MSIKLEFSPTNIDVPSFSNEYFFLQPDARFLNYIAVYSGLNDLGLFYFIVNILLPCNIK